MTSIINEKNTNKYTTPTEFTKKDSSFLFVSKVGHLNKKDYHKRYTFKPTQRL